MEHARLGYRQNLDSLDGPQLFDEGVRVLLPPGSPRKALEDLFDRRARYDTIKRWRLGIRHPPDWANKLLADKIRGYFEPLIRRNEWLAKKLREIPDRPGLSAGAKNLAAYNARRHNDGAKNRGSE